MKKILGLDLGSASIGWAIVNEAETDTEQSSIIRLGVRVVQHLNCSSKNTKGEISTSMDPVADFLAGKGISSCAMRTSKRGMRKRLDRYHDRRRDLIEILKKNNIISDDSILCENGNNTTFQTYMLRERAVTEEITLEELARVLLMINKKRGYKSNRKERGNDGKNYSSVNVAKYMSDNDLTPGQYCLQLLDEKKKRLPDFYRSDLREEQVRIWTAQKKYYTFELTDELYDKVIGNVGDKVAGILNDAWKIDKSSKSKKQSREDFEIRVKALTEKIDLEQISAALQNIAKQMKNSSGYLGDIADRSKELVTGNLTVGQYKMKILRENPNQSIKKLIFYRSDYMDEFEKIWERQRSFHHELDNDELKKEIRDRIIFYQRRLKSQKHLISLCQFENKEVVVEENGKERKRLVGLRCCPISSPLYQEFIIWQRLNDLRIKSDNRLLTLDEKNRLFNELDYREKLSEKDIKRILGLGKDDELDFNEVRGNNTKFVFFKNIVSAINSLDDSNDDESLLSNLLNGKKNGDFHKTLTDSLRKHNLDANFLDFDSSAGDVEAQPFYRLWHLIYSWEDDSNSLEKKLETICGKEFASYLACCSFKADYGNLSSKAVKKILPFMKQGFDYSQACQKAGYNHSRSLTKQDLDNRKLADKVEFLQSGALRNPVVEKVLNQMANVVNEVISEYGKPDEIRVELARELKKSAKERQEISDGNKEQEKKINDLKKKISDVCGIPEEKITKNDILRARLYDELKENKYNCLYSDRHIESLKEAVMSGDITIEHIIPRALLFDDSFSNKTLEFSKENTEKSNRTGYDYVATLGDDKLNKYVSAVELLAKTGSISAKKRANLLTQTADIKSDFIARDLRETQYISKMAVQMLGCVVKSVVPTCGSISDRLRNDWGLVDVMKELNIPKYEKLGLVERFTDHHGNQQVKIKNWTKRNDHRHHAMDALTVAFTKRAYINYLNNLNSRVDKYPDDYIDLDLVEWSNLDDDKKTAIVMAIQKKYMQRDKHNNLRFVPPMSDNFRLEAKKHLEMILISIKNRNRVVTNRVVYKKDKTKINLITPRGALHDETICGLRKCINKKWIKVNTKLNEETIKHVINQTYREALLARLIDFNGDNKKAFSLKELKNKPILLPDGSPLPDEIEITEFVKVITKRVAVDGDLEIECVIDDRIKSILQSRLNDFNGDNKKAFSNLENNPIWFNKQKNIAIKKVLIRAVDIKVDSAEPLKCKHDHFGNDLTDNDGKKIPCNFVKTNSNHHVAIYKDENGNLQERVVSFWEAVTSKKNGLPVVDANYNGWKLQFTMMRNDYFVFPNPETGFDPRQVDMTDVDNYSLISPNLYFVQQLSSKNYTFRHHLETTKDKSKELNGIACKRIRSINNELLLGAVKVRINHAGKIVEVGQNNIF